MGPAWVLATLLVLTVAHLALVALAARGDWGPAGTETGDALGRPDDGIECPDCGTVNQPEYRYCRQCVATLPGPMPSVRASERATGRRIP